MVQENANHHSTRALKLFLKFFNVETLSEMFIAQLCSLHSYTMRVIVPESTSLKVYFSLIRELKILKGYIVHTLSLIHLPTELLRQPI